MHKVLVIDDVEAARATIREMLERGGFEVFEAANGREGLKVIEQQTLDLVITDIIMPDMEGLETIRRIIQTQPYLPVIAITASIGTPFLDTALRFGAVSGLYKPFRQAELLSAVRKALRKAKLFRAKQLNSKKK